VEDTLNNSNDLFLTFRKEMEEMSKKTKRLEKENLTLTRKHDLTNRNILEMAEERTKTNAEIVNLQRKNKQLTDIIKQMQIQGRGLPQDQSSVEGEINYTEGEGELSEAEYEYGTEAEDYDDVQTEEEHPPHYGPIPPSDHTCSNGVQAGELVI
jgi:seryl-tRNA synthetase